MPPGRLDARAAGSRYGLQGRLLARATQRVAAKNLRVTTIVETPGLAARRRHAATDPVMGPAEEVSSCSCARISRPGGHASRHLQALAARLERLDRLRLPDLEREGATVTVPRHHPVASRSTGVSLGDEEAVLLALPVPEDPENGRILVCRVPPSLKGDSRLVFSPSRSFKPRPPPPFTPGGTLKKRVGSRFQGRWRRRCGGSPRRSRRGVEGAEVAPAQGDLLATPGPRTSTCGSPSFQRRISSPTRRARRTGPSRPRQNDATQACRKRFGGTGVGRGRRSDDPAARRACGGTRRGAPGRGSRRSLPSTSSKRARARGAGAGGEQARVVEQRGLAAPVDDHGGVDLLGHQVAPEHAVAPSPSPRIRSASA